MLFIIESVKGLLVLETNKQDSQNLSVIPIRGAESTSQ